MICLIESYLDSYASSDNDNLCIKDYKLLRADHPGNVKTGGFRLFHGIFTCQKSLLIFALKSVLP